jgi:IS30 family transposase
VQHSGKIEYMPYKQISIEERERIQEMLWQKSSVRSIATALGRSASSVSREINKNIDSIGRRVYIPRAANEKALVRRKNRGRKDRLKNQEVRNYVVEHLKKRWSPEQIAKRIKIDLGESISYEAIYQYIYAQIHQNGWGYLKPGHEDLRMYLRRRRKRRMRKGLRKPQRIPSFEGVSIDLRPNIVEKRVRVGDWESDTVESIRESKYGINTCVERKTGLVLITKLANKKSEETLKAITTRMIFIPNNAKCTITFDNGSENSSWRELERMTGLKAFFCHQYHSWERGTNENTNGLIRDYFPKKTDFATINEQQLAYVENELNSRPRKRLGWKTPLETWSVALRG